MSLEDTTPYGRLRYVNGELCNDAVRGIIDPPKVRFGCAEGALGAVSGDVILYDGNGNVVHRAERTLVTFKDHDPESAGDALKCGAIEFFTALEGREDDAGMIRCMTITPHVIRFKVPVQLADGSWLGGVSPGAPNYFPPNAPTPRGGSQAGLQTYQNYMRGDVQRVMGKTASTAQLQLLTEYQTRYGYLDDNAYNWVIGTLVYSGAVK